MKFSDKRQAQKEKKAAIKAAKLEKELMFVELPPAMLKRAAAKVKGLSISWSDPNPLSETKEIHNQEVSHADPVSRLLSWDIWCEHKEWLINSGALLWRININIVFEYNGVTQHEERQVLRKGKLFDTGVACDLVIADAGRHGENAVNAIFKCECLGNRSPKVSDYTEGFEP